MEIRKMTIDDYEAVFDLWVNTPNMGLRMMNVSIQIYTAPYMPTPKIHKECLQK